MSEWISVKDRLPEQDTTVLAWSEYDDYYIVSWFEGGEFDDKSVTHWQLLPQPPESEETE